MNLNTIQIDNKLENVNGFLGAYAYDEIPSKPKKKLFSLVVNTSSSHEPGDHWLVLVYRDGIYYFLDSFGRDYNDETFPNDFRGVIKKFIGSEPCKFNRDIVQYLLSNACGDYAIYFVYRLSKNDRLNDILNVFNSDLLYNDYFVTQFVKHIYIFVLLLTEISEMNTLLEIYFGGDKCRNFDSLIILH